MKGEEHLIEQAKIDPNAFATIYDINYPRIFTYVFRISGDYNLSRDITAETFAKALLKIGSFNWKGISISSWLFRIATNELNQYFRKKKYTPVLTLDLSLYDRIEPGTKANDEANATLSRIYMTENFQDLHKKLSSLSADYRKVIALRYFEELSVKEISLILHKKEGTIKSLLSRGIQMLRKLMEVRATE